MQFWKISLTWNHVKNPERQKRSKYRKELSNLYKETLHREPDFGGNMRYLTLLMNDEITIEEIRDEMLESQEYFETIVLDPDNIPKPLVRESKKIISEMYKEILKRKSDKSGLNHYALLLASRNMTEKEIRDEMLESQEYFFRIVLDTDNIPKPLVRESKKIISGMYIETLNRKPNWGILNHYALLLASGHMTKKVIREEMIISSERRALEQDLRYQPFY